MSFCETRSATARKQLSLVDLKADLLVSKTYCTPISGSAMRRWEKRKKVWGIIRRKHQYFVFLAGIITI